MKRTIYLVDGLITEGENFISVEHKILGEVADVDAECDFNPGQLRVTIEALNQLGKVEMVKVFARHLKAVSFSRDSEAINEFQASIEDGSVIYNIDRKLGVMIVTYPDDNSTLILTGQY